VYEQGFATMMDPAVGEDITDIVEGEIPLRQSSIGVLRDHGHSRFSHRLASLVLALSPTQIV
jgi:hypothetical protein